MFFMPKVNLLFRARTIYLPLPQTMLAGLLQLFFELFDPLLTPPLYVSLLRGPSRHLCRRHNHFAAGPIITPITSSIFKTDLKPSLKIPVAI